MLGFLLNFHYFLFEMLLPFPVVVVNSEKFLHRDSRIKDGLGIMVLTYGSLSPPEAGVENLQFKASLRHMVKC